MQFKLWNYIFLSACLCLPLILALPRRVDHDDMVDSAHLKPANPNDDRPLVNQQDVPDAEDSAASSDDDGSEIVPILRPRPKKSAQEGDEYYGDYSEYTEYVQYEETEDTPEEEIPNSNEYLEQDEDIQGEYEIVHEDDGYADESDFERKERRTRKTAAVKAAKRSPTSSKKTKSIKKRSVAAPKKRSPIASALKKIVKRSPVQALLKNYEGKRSTSSVRAKKQARKMRSEETPSSVSDEDENDAVVVESCDSLLEECQADTESPKCSEYEKLCLSPVESGGEFEDTFFCEDENGQITTNCISPLGSRK